MATKCKYCKLDKLESEMVERAGKPSKVCIECKEKRTGLGGSAAGGKTQKKKGAAARRPKRAAALEIDVPGGGHGFKASLTDEDCLLITQENADAEADNVVLTRGEAHAMFEIFSEWAAE